MGHERHQSHIEQLRDDQHHHGNFYGRADVLAGVITGRQHLDGHQPQQTGPIPNQGDGDLAYVAVEQGAVVEQRGHQRRGKGEQCHRSGHGQQHHDAQTPVEHGRITLRVTRGLGGGKLGRQHHAQRYAQQRGGKLHQPVGIKQPGDAARRQVRSDLGIDHERNLRHTHAQQCRSHQRENAPHAGLGPGGAHGAPAHADARQQAQPVQHRQLHRQLQHATQHDPPGHRVNGFDATGGQLRGTQPGRSDHAQIQQHRRGGGHGKTLPGVEHARRQRHHRHETDVGEHPARHQHGGIKAVRALAQAAGQQPHQKRRTHHPQHASEQQHPRQRCGHCGNQHARGGITMLGLGSGQHRHERLAESALGKQAPQQIGDAKCHIEGIGQRVGAKHRGHQEVAHQARHAGGQGQEGDGGGGFEQGHRGKCSPPEALRAFAQRGTHQPWPAQASSIAALANARLRFSAAATVSLIGL